MFDHYVRVPLTVNSCSQRLRIGGVFLVSCLGLIKFVYKEYCACLYGYLACLLMLLYVFLFFSMDLVVTATTPNFVAQINYILMLSGMNFKSWKESVEIVLGCMDLDLSLREERPTVTADNPN